MNDLSRHSSLRVRLAALILGSTGVQPRRIENKIDTLIQEIKNMAKTMQDLVTEVAAVKDTNESVKTFMSGLIDKLKAAQQAAQQNQDTSQLDQVIADLEASRQSVADAVTSGGNAVSGGSTSGGSPAGGSAGGSTGGTTPAAPAGGTTPSGT